MAFLCSAPEPNLVQTTQSSSYPAWYSDALQRLTGKADVIANEPYQAYGGQRVAELGPDYSGAFAKAREAAGAYQPDFGTARGLAGVAGQQFPEMGVERYMNPYLQNVIDISKREAGVDYGKARNELGARAASAGAFGGSRQAILESELGRNYAQRLGDIQQTGLSSAYDRAQAAADADRRAALAASQQYGSLGEASQRAGLAGAAGLQSIADVQRGYQQQTLDVPYGEFQAQRAYPREQASWLSSILRGTQPPATVTSQQPFGSTASPLQQVGGLGLTALGLFGGKNPMVKFNRGGVVKRMYKGGGLVSLAGRQ